MQGSISIFYSWLLVLSKTQMTRTLAEVLFNWSWSFANFYFFSICSLNWIDRINIWFSRWTPIAQQREVFGSFYNLLLILSVKLKAKPCKYSECVDVTCTVRFYTRFEFRHRAYVLLSHDDSRYCCKHCMLLLDSYYNNYNSLRNDEYLLERLVGFV